jgi:hypothetical protein
LQKNFKVLTPSQGFVTLHVDVHIGIDGLCDLVDAVGSAAMGRRGQADAPSVGAADRRDFFRVGSDDDIVQRRTRSRRGVNVRQHRAAVDLTQDLSRESCRSKPGGNDGDSFHPASLLAASDFWQAG